MSTCCELGTRPYSENQLGNKENSLSAPKTYSQCSSYVSPFFPSLSVPQWGWCSQTASPWLPRHQSGSRHREALVGSRREREDRIFFALVLYLCSCYSTSSVVPTSSKGHSEHVPRWDHGLMRASSACFQLWTGHPGFRALLAPRFPFVPQDSNCY